MKMKKKLIMKMKKNFKKIDQITEYISENIGDIQDGVMLENNGIVICMLDVKPKQDADYRLIMTAGLSTLDNEFLPNNICGIELYVRVPKDWKFTYDEDYECGWIRRVFTQIAELISSGKAIIFGSTLAFEHLINGSKHSAIAIGVNDNDNFVMRTKKGRIVYFNVQTITSQERERLIKDDEELLDKICNLPYIDVSRESFV